MAANKYEFDALIKRNYKVDPEDNDLPFDVSKEFCGKGRV